MHHVWLTFPRIWISHFKKSIFLTYQLEKITFLNINISTVKANYTWEMPLLLRWKIMVNQHPHEIYLKNENRNNRQWKEPLWNSSKIRSKKLPKIEENKIKTVKRPDIIIIWSRNLINMVHHLMIIRHAHAITAKWTTPRHL